MERESLSKIPEARLQELTDEFADFVVSRDYTAEQITKAYHLFLAGDSAAGASEEVRNIYHEMRRLEKEGFTPNRFARFIEVKQDYEDSPATYSQYVDSLEISDREKSILRSIVEQFRSGTIQCMTEDGDVISIEVNTEGMTKENLSADLRKTLKKFVNQQPKGQKYGFTFSER